MCPGGYLTSSGSMMLRRFHRAGRVRVWRIPGDAAPALARLPGWKVTLRQLALLAGRKQGDGGYGRGEAEATGIPKNPHQLRRGP